MKSKRVFAFLVITVLCLTSFHTALAVTPNGVLDLFGARVNRGNANWKIDKIDKKAEGTVNGHSYSLHVNSVNGKVTEIVFRGWFDDLKWVPRGEGMGYTWGPGGAPYFAFTCTVCDLGLFEDDNYSEGPGPLSSEDTYTYLQRGSMGGIDMVEKYWKDITMRKGLIEATNIATGMYVLLRGWEHGEFEAYIRLP
ncbi:MAG: hypothetical protein IJ174_08170 [Clostridia bacterium]|nr:hypothetical protein [Clostridia bacterium]